MPIKLENYATEYILQDIFLTKSFDFKWNNICDFWNNNSGNNST